MTSFRSQSADERRGSRWISSGFLLALSLFGGCAQGLPPDRPPLTSLSEPFGEAISENRVAVAPSSPAAPSVPAAQRAETPAIASSPQQVDWEEAIHLGDDDAERASQAAPARPLSLRRVSPLEESSLDSDMATSADMPSGPVDLHDSVPAVGSAKATGNTSMVMASDVDEATAPQEPLGSATPAAIRQTAWQDPGGLSLPPTLPDAALEPPAGPPPAVDGADVASETLPPALDRQVENQGSEDPQREIPIRQTLPFPENAVDDEAIELSVRDDRLSVRAVDASLDGVLGMIAEQQGLNIISGNMQDERITVTLKNVRLHDALDTILAVKGYTWSQQNNIVVVSKLGGDATSAVIQGREVRVYNLNYTSADDVQSVVTGLLSPAGQVFINQTSADDQRQTHEQLVVEDLPRYLARVEAYLQQADIPPKQVVVEAHVLQVELEDDLRHGINFDHLLMRIAGSKVSLESKAFAAEQGPTTLLRIEGHDLKGLVEAIQTNTNAKTLASPKVAVLNGQQAKMQVGGQIGYLLTTTTQTSTMQSVDFLDIGVILTVTPIITEDQQILLQVKPEVSTGRINATTQLPESETTQVETTVMLADGEAIVIGGLIQEADTETESKVPWLGDIKGIGRIFQKRETKRTRSEIIIALVPRIVSAVPGCRAVEVEEIQRAMTPLMHGPLHPNDRRMWEPELPSAKLP